MKLKNIISAFALLIALGVHAETKTFGDSNQKTWVATNTDGCSSGSTIILDGMVITLGSAENNTHNWTWNVGNQGLVPDQMPSTEGSAETVINTFSTSAPYGTLPIQGGYLVINTTKSSFLSIAGVSGSKKSYVLAEVENNTVVGVQMTKEDLPVANFLVEANKTYYFFLLAKANNLTSWRYTLKSISVNPTTVIVNADFQTDNGGTTGTPTGWTLSTTTWTNKTSNFAKGGGTISGNPNNHWQIWNSKAMTGKAYQKLSNLPNGVYTIQVTLVCDFNGRVKLYGNNNSKAVVSGTYGIYSLDAIVSDGTLELGLDFIVTSGSPDLEIDDFTLTYKQPAGDYNGEVCLSDLDNLAQMPIDNVDVTLSRSLSNEYWNSFSVPFSMSVPEGWQVKQVASIADNTIIFEDANTIEAGKPYFVKPAVAETYHTFSNVDISTTEGSVDGTESYKFAAQLIHDTSLATDGSLAYLATDGKVKKLTAGSIKGLRAYFVVPISSLGRELQLVLGDGSTTGITSLEASQLIRQDTLYDLAGRRVSLNNMRSKGIYIMGGRKVSVR